MTVQFSQASQPYPSCTLKHRGNEGGVTSLNRYQPPETCNQSSTVHSSGSSMPASNSFGSASVSVSAGYCFCHRVRPFYIRCPAASRSMSCSQMTTSLQTSTPTSTSRHNVRPTSIVQRPPHVQRRLRSVQRSGPSNVRQTSASPLTSASRPNVRPTSIVQRPPSSQVRRCAHARSPVPRAPSPHSPPP